MSRLLRRNTPCRGCRDCHSTKKDHRDEEKDHRDEEEDYRDEEDGHDHRLDELRRALHHFTLGVEIPSDSDESEEEDTLGVDTPSQSDKSEEEDHPDEEDDLGDPRLGELREALFALADCLSCSDDENEEEHGQSQDEA